MKILPRSFIIVMAFASLVCAEDSVRFDQLMKLEGKAFVQETKQACEQHLDELSGQQLCALATRLYQEPNDENFIARIMVFASACQKGDAGTLPDLLRIFSALSKEDAIERAQLLVPLADLWLFLKAADWSQHPPPVVQFPKWKGRTPLEVKTLPPDLQKAWITWRQTTAPFATKSPKLREGDVIAYQMESKSFWTLVDDLLAGRGKTWSGRLLKYQWVGWCGTGQEELIVPQSWALIMAFFSEGRLPEAVGATFGAQPGFLYFCDGENYRGLHQLLQGSGSHWEEAIAGGLVNAASVFSVGDQLSRSIGLRLLIEYGGEESARLLLLTSRDATPEARLILLCAAARFVAPGPSRQEPRSGWLPFSDCVRYNSEPISDKTQIEILQEISNQVVDNSRFEVSEKLAETLASLRRPETRDALYRLLQHPSETIARRAADTLEKLGEKVTMPPKLGPVRYQVFVNGQPFAKKEIWWHLKTGSCSKNSQAETDEAGIVSLKRDDFFDQTYSPAKVRLYSAQMKSTADLWFNVNVPAPGDTDSPTVVKLETTSFDLLLPSSVIMFASSDPELKISKMLEDGTLDPVGSFSIPRSSPSLHFAALPPAVYHLEITAPKIVSWSDNIDTAKVDSLTVPLARGRDVHFSLSMPEGWDPRMTFLDLRKDGAPCKVVDQSLGDSGFRTFPRLPVGKYVLKIPSSKELHKFDPRLFPARPAFEGTEFPFEIAPDSPSEINLGELRPKLLSVAAGRKGVL